MTFMRGAVRFGLFIAFVAALAAPANAQFAVVGSLLSIDNDGNIAGESFTVVVPDDYYQWDISPYV